MNNIILNIVSKKENLSYPQVFKKISKYYWNAKTLCNRYRCSIENLCNKIVNKNYRKMFGYVPVNKLLGSACYSGNMDIVKYCFENKATITEDHKVAFKLSNGTPLHVATCGNKIEIVKFLVENNYYDHKFYELYGAYIRAKHYRYLDIAEYIFAKMHAN